MKIVVTGGGGFIGSAIVRHLLEKGDRLTVIGRSRYPFLERIGVCCRQGDISDAAFMTKSLKGAELVFHVAAKAGIWGRKEEYERINIRGTENCIRACRDNGVAALVYTSTPSVVFDGKDIEGGNESLPYAGRPLCHYASTKIIAEQRLLAASSSDLKTTAIRPHLVWGPGDPHLLPRLFERARKGKLKIIGSGTNRVDITYIDNVVHAHVQVARNLLAEGTAAGRAFFVGQEKPVVLWQWINALLEQEGLKPVTRRIPHGCAYLIGTLLEGVYRATSRRGEPPMTRFVAQQLARSHWFDHGAAREIFGYAPGISVEEGMECLARNQRAGHMA
jgi:nucleoside-diphosphate-sugar epimerase